MNLFDLNILNTTNKERVEFFLLTCFFVIIGSWLYQKFFCRNIDANLIVVIGIMSLIPYFFIISFFLWNKVACILTGLLFGFLVTRKIL